MRPLYIKLKKIKVFILKKKMFSVFIFQEKRKILEIKNS